MYIHTQLGTIIQIILHQLDDTPVQKINQVLLQHHRVQIRSQNIIKLCVISKHIRTRCLKQYLHAYGKSFAQIMKRTGPKTTLPSTCNIGQFEKHPLTHNHYLLLSKMFLIHFNKLSPTL